MIHGVRMGPQWRVNLIKNFENLLLQNHLARKAVACLQASSGSLKFLQIMIPMGRMGEGNFEIGIKKETF